MQCVSCMIRITDDTLFILYQKLYVSFLIQVTFSTEDVTIMNRNKNFTLAKRHSESLRYVFPICFILASSLLGVDTSYNRALLFQEVLYACHSLRFLLYRAQRFG